MKLLVTDLDGTLLDEDHKINDETLLLLREFETLGYGVTFATGRSIPAALPHIERARIRLPAILFNGCMIFDPIAFKPLKLHVMRRSTVMKVIKEVPMDVSLLVFSNENIYAVNPVKDLNGYLKRDGIVCEFVDGFQEVDLRGVIKILLVGSRGRLDELFEDLRSGLHGNVSVVRSESDLIEVLPRGVNKGTGLIELSTLLKVQLSDVVAVGDSMNDIEMLQTAGLGVAVGNAREEVKNSADLVMKGERYKGLQELLQIIKRGVPCEANKTRY